MCMQRGSRWRPGALEALRHGVNPAWRAVPDRDQSPALRRRVYPAESPLARVIDACGSIAETRLAELSCAISGCGSSV